jgi:VanZ family protein
MSEISTQPRFLRSVLIYHLPFLLFAAAILIVSRIPNLKGPDLRILPFDKLAHFGEYSIFAFLTFRSFSHVGRPNHLVTAMVTSILFIAGFAAFDEYSQRFVQGRVSDPMDFVTDLAGAVLVVLFFWLRAWRKGREERP